MTTSFKPTLLQRLWLETKGGRWAKDVFIGIDGNYYISMFNGEKKEYYKVEVPEDKYINFSSWQMKRLMHRKGLRGRPRKGKINHSR
jgi:hypothetical protein